MKRKSWYLAAALAVLLGLAVPLAHIHIAERGAGDPATTINPPGGIPEENGPGVNHLSGPPGAGPAESEDKPATDNIAGTLPGGGTASSRQDRPAPPIAGPTAPFSPKPAVPPSQASGSTRPEGGCRVEVAVLGRDGKMLFGPAVVTVTPEGRWGLSALGALDATGLRYMTYDVYYQTSKYHNFVVCIEGEVNQGASGWMYKVNEKTPLAAADEERIKPGDKVIWWYSQGLGSPAPTWDSLKAAVP